MKYIKQRKSITVEAQNAAEFDKRLNEALLKCGDKNLQVVDFPAFPLMVRIYYTEEREIAETISEEYEICGRGAFCGECPFYQPQLNKDGTKKRTSKRGFCGLEARPTFEDMRACDAFYTREEE